MPVKREHSPSGQGAEKRIKQESRDGAALHPSIFDLPAHMATPSASAATPPAPAAAPSVPAAIPPAPASTAPASAATPLVPAATAQPMAQLKRVPPNPNDFFYVICGPKKDRFFEDKIAIFPKCPFLKTASEAREQKDKIGDVELPSIEPYVWKVCQHWLYFDELNLDCTEHPQGKGCASSHGAQCAEEKCKKSDRGMTLMKVYVAATLLQLPALSWLCIDEVSYGLRAEIIDYVWQKTRAKCGMQRKIVDLLANCTPESLDRNFLPTKCLKALVVRFANVRGQAMHTYDPAEVAKCFYHDHEDGKTCA